MPRPGTMGARQVRRILRLEERANRWLVRWNHAHRRAVRAKARAFALLDEAIGVEHRLTAHQLAELHRARGEHGAAADSVGQPVEAPTDATHAIQDGRPEATVTTQSRTTPAAEEAHAWTTTDHPR